MSTDPIYKITKFCWVDRTGNTLAPENSIDWYTAHNSIGFGPIVGYQWLVNGTQIKVSINSQEANWYPLPDASGFICFEAGWKPDNCLLLDAYGKERMRLAVPWQLTGAESTERVTFGNVDGPYINPADSKMGRFGVNGWVSESKFYFELNYHTGHFPWCKRIRD